jgi:hypothetical protein
MNRPQQACNTDFRAYSFMDLELAEAIAKQETLNALRDAISRERLVLHRSLAGLSETGSHAPKLSLRLVGRVQPILEDCCSLFADNIAGEHFCEF